MASGGWCVAGLLPAKVPSGIVFLVARGGTGTLGLPTAATAHAYPGCAGGVLHRCPGAVEHVLGWDAECERSSAEALMVRAGIQARE